MLAVASPLRSANIGTDERAPEGVGGAFSSDAIHLADDGLLDSIDFTGFFQGLGDDLVDVLPETHFSISHDTFFPDLPYTTATAVEQIPEHEKELPPPVPAVTSNPSSGQNPTPPPARPSHRKKKGKVEWTPELHRKFVQAVEQLGVEKAVPSRILELMGIHSLTRHNVASHLQKYRSQRKHLLAREAEAASWTQRRGGGGLTPRESNSSWLSPTMGFPPPLHAPYMRPLHVWGHPTVGRPPGLIGPWPSPAPHWPHQTPNYLNYWQTLYHGDLRQEWSRSAAVTALPLFPQPPAFRFATPTVSVVPPHAENFVPQWKQHSNAHPSKESIDAAIEEVLEKPWLPLPLGLKAPSTESVLVELQKQGVPKVPPSLQC